MIDPVTIGPLTLEGGTDKIQEAEANMLSRMRGLASAVKNLQEYDEWNMSSRESSVPWGQLTAAQSAVGTQIGHIGLSPNVYTTNTTHPYQNLTTTGLNTTTGTSIGIGPDYNMKVAQTGQIDIRGTDADIRINGKSMNRWMEQVEQRLNILTVNPELEKEWDELRRLGERYRKLEKKCQEKAKMWEALKKLPKVKT
jgi:hypothetical protein